MDRRRSRNGGFGKRLREFEIRQNGDFMNILLTFMLVLAASVFAACESGGAPEKTEKTAANEIRQISVEEANEAVSKQNGVQFIDVRTVSEYDSGHAPKAVNMPLETLENEFARLDKDQPVYIICQTGRRSQMAAETLQKAGFRDIYNITGGTSAWSSANLPLEK